MCSAADERQRGEQQLAAVAAVWAERATSGCRVERPRASETERGAGGEIQKEKKRGRKKKEKEKGEEKIKIKQRKKEEMKIIGEDRKRKGKK